MLRSASHLSLTDGALARYDTTHMDLEGILRTFWKCVIVVKSSCSICDQYLAAFGAMILGKKKDTLRLSVSKTSQYIMRRESQQYHSSQSDSLNYKASSTA